MELVKEWLTGKIGKSLVSPFAKRGGEGGGGSAVFFLDAKTENMQFVRHCPY